MPDFRNMMSINSMARALQQRKVFVATLLSALCMSAHAFDLTVTIDQIKHIKGNLSVALFDSENGYKNSKPVFARQIPVTEASMDVKFEDLLAGEYAVKLYQDENGNGSLDTGLFGIPTEGYGFSNNGGSFGPPDYKDAKFIIDEHKKIIIHLR